jgi:hypothetical protein
MIERLRQSVLRLRGLFSRPGLAYGLMFSGLMLAVPLVVQADVVGAIADFIMNAVAWFFDLLVQLMGWIFLQLVSTLLSVMQYANFVAPGPTAVRYGWVVVRDLANMFFILILLIIAFATILSYEEYNYRKLLPRLLIMSVVINFSKTITGIFIDFGQVVMLTFVNGFIQAAGGNFARGFQIDKMLSMRANSTGSASSIALAMILAFILLTVACSVMLILVCMMAFRIVYLWILIILSPIAFLSSTFPPAREYYARWWKELRTYVITGPIVAFFVWLALLSFQKAGEIQGGNIAKDAQFLAASAAEAETAQAISRFGAGGPANEAARKDIFVSFIIATAMLMAGLKVAVESGAAGVGMGKAIQGYAKRGATWAGKFAGRQAMKPVGAAGAAALTGVGGLAAKSGLRPVAALGRMAALQGERMKEKRRKEVEGRYGAPEDVARLSPTTFAERLGSIKDPRQLQRWTKAALANPNAMTAAQAAQRDPVTGATFTNAGLAMKNLKNLIDGKGDPRFKDDPDLKSAFDDLARRNLGEVTDDLTGVRGSGEKEFKRLVSTMNVDDARKYMKADDVGRGIRSGALTGGQLLEISKNGKDEQKGALAEALRDLGAADAQQYLAKRNVNATDVTADLMDVPGVADYVFEKIKNNPAARTDVMSDADKAKKLQEVAGRRYTDALANPAASSVSKAEAVVDAISFGKVTAGDIEGNLALQNALVAGLDVSQLNKKLNLNDAGQANAAKSALAAVMAANPDREDKIRKSGFYDHLIDDGKVSQMKVGRGIAGMASGMAGLAAAGAAPVAAAAARPPAAPPPPVQIDRAAADTLAEAIGKRLVQLGDALKGPSSPMTSRNQKEFDKLTAAVKELKSALDASASREKALSEAQKNAQNPSFTDAARKDWVATAERLEKALRDDAEQILKLQNELRGKV